MTDHGPRGGHDTRHNRSNVPGGCYKSYIRACCVSALEDALTQSHPLSRAKLVLKYVEVSTNYNGNGPSLN